MWPTGKEHISPRQIEFEQKCKEKDLQLNFHKDWGNYTSTETCAVYCAWILLRTEPNDSNLSISE